MELHSIYYYHLHNTYLLNVILIIIFSSFTLNHKDRVLYYVQQTDHQRSKIQFEIDLHYLETKNLGLYDPTVKLALSIDR